MEPAYKSEWTPIDEGKPAAPAAPATAQEIIPGVSSADFDSEIERLSGSQSIAARLLADDEEDEPEQRPEPQPERELSAEDFAKGRAEALKDPAVGLWTEEELAEAVDADPSLYVDPKTPEDLAHNRRIAAQQKLLAETSQEHSALARDLILEDAQNDYEFANRPPRDIANELRESAPEALEEFLETWRGDEPGEVLQWQDEAAMADQMGAQIQAANEHTKAQRAERQQLEAQNAEIWSSTATASRPRRWT